MFIGLGEGWLADRGSEPTADDIAAHLAEISATDEFSDPSRRTTRRSSRSPNGLARGEAPDLVALTKHWVSRANPRRESEPCRCCGASAVTSSNAGHAYDDGTRRTEILQTAASLIATSGLRTSLQEIADAAGILPGSLYHHFESKEAILVELLRRYHTDLDRVAEHALSRLDDASRPCPPFERIVDLGAAIAQCAVTHRAALQMTFYEAHGAESGPDCTRPATTHGHSGGDGADAAGRTVERLHQTRCRPSRAGRPDLVQMMLQVGLDVIRHNASADKLADAAVPNPAAGLGRRAAHR